MKQCKKQSTLFVAALISILLGTAHPALSSTDAGGIGVIDMTVVSKSLVSKNIRDQIEKKRAEYHTEISKAEEALKKEGQELGKQRGSLSQEAFEKKSKTFREKMMAVQRKTQMRKAQLEQAYVKAVSEVQKVVLDIVGKLAEERSFSLVITSAQVLYNKPTVDISNEVLKRLDAKLTAVPVKIEELPQGEKEKKTNQKN